MTAFQFRPAKRSEAKPLIGIYAQSGAGKTYGALLIARGFVGPQGRIGMIETESGRGEAYADPIEYPEFAGADRSAANYEVLPLRGDFSPQTYGKALEAAEAAKLDALIIDSASHEWEGLGGVLDMAAKKQEAGKKGPLVWQQPKIDHQRHFMLRFMQTPIPLVILCMRAKYPMREVPKPGGGKEWQRLDELVPKQSEDILFEMFIHGWIGQDHRFHLTRCSAKALEGVFADGQPLKLETGAQLREWAEQRPNGKAPEPPAPDPLDEAKAEARKGTESFRAWWAGRPKTENAKLKGHVAELKRIAEDADRAAAEADVPDDPFAGEDAPGEAPAPENGDRLGHLRDALAGCTNLDAVDSLEADERAAIDAWPAAERAKAENAFMARREELSR